MVTKDLAYACCYALGSVQIKPTHIKSKINLIRVVDNTKSFIDALKEGDMAGKRGFRRPLSTTVSSRESSMVQYHPYFGI